jgi:hypothetical protein
MKQMVEAALAAHIAQLQAEAAQNQQRQQAVNASPRGDVYVREHQDGNGHTVKAYTRRRGN